MWNMKNVSKVNYPKRKENIKSLKRFNQNTIETSHPGVFVMLPWIQIVLSYKPEIVFN